MNVLHDASRGWTVFRSNSGRSVIRRSLAMVLAIAIPSLTAYVAVAKWRQHSEREELQVSMASPRFPTGKYLTAYVLLSSKCHFCTEDSTKAAIRNLRPMLLAAARGRYANIAVVGVALDPDVEGEMRYIRGLGDVGMVFDEISVGGSWMNDIIADVVWRDGFATPEIPQVVLLERRVDASEYPTYIDIGQESMIYHAVGDAFTDWVYRGAPLPRQDPEQ